MGYDGLYCRNAPLLFIKAYAKGWQTWATSQMQTKALCRMVPNCNGRQWCVTAIRNTSQCKLQVFGSQNSLNNGVVFVPCFYYLSNFAAG